MTARARLVGINHVALEVDDLEQALSFYGQIFELDLRGRVPGMAFVDIGDQFIALAEGRSQPPDEGRHFGLVVDDRERVRAALERAGADILPGARPQLPRPVGNHVQAVQYADVQFTKSERGTAGDGPRRSSARARRRWKELREKGLGSGVTAPQQALFSGSVGYRRLPIAPSTRTTPFTAGAGPPRGEHVAVLAQQRAERERSRHPVPSHAALAVQPVDGPEPLGSVRPAAASARHTRGSAPGFHI